MPDRTHEFYGQMLGHVGGALVMGVVTLADRTGLLRQLADGGPCTQADLTTRTGIAPSYLREMLATLVAAGIATHDPEDGTFRLPPEVRTCLVDETNPLFVGGWTDLLPALFGALPRVTQAILEGSGVPFASYGEGFVRGLERWEGPYTRVALVDRWISQMPDTLACLTAGGRAADIGCSAGSGTIALAKAFPKAEVVGFDLDPGSIARATAAAASAGVPNVRFELVDARALPTDPPFDFVMILRALHDLASPRDVLRRVREALRPDGACLIVEPPAVEHMPTGPDPMAAARCAVSALHCVPAALAGGGVALGSAFGPADAEEYCRSEGFSRFRRLTTSGGSDGIYEARP